jgi:uncharacterized protein
MRGFHQGMAMLSRGAVRLALGFILISGIVPVTAEPIGLGSMPAGSPSYGMALAIAKAAKEGAGLDVLPKPFKSTGQAVPLVNKGELSFAFSNAAELAAAWNGTGVFKDRSAKSLRLVARLFPFRMAIAVRKDDPAQTIADLKGRTLPSGFTTTTTGDQLLLALLSTAGLSYQDVKTVQVADFPAMRDAFVDRRTDITVLVIGSGADIELARKVGGIRILELPQGDDIDAKIKAVFPVARTEMLDPKDSGSVTEKPARVMSYDFYLYANEAAPPEVVKSLIASMLERHDTLVAAYPSFAWLNAKNIVGDIGLPYHAAAEQYYREHQLWPPGP